MVATWLLSRPQATATGAGRTLAFFWLFFGVIVFRRPTPFRIVSISYQMSGATKPLTLTQRLFFGVIVFRRPTLHRIAAAHNCTCT